MLQSPRRLQQRWEGNSGVPGVVSVMQCGYSQCHGPQLSPCVQISRRPGHYLRSRDAHLSKLTAVGTVCRDRWWLGGRKTEHVFSIHALSVSLHLSLSLSLALALSLLVCDNTHAHTHLEV